MLRLAGLRAAEPSLVRSQVVSTDTLNFLATCKGDLPPNPIDRRCYDFEKRVLPVAAQAGAGLLAMKVFGGATPHTGPQSVAHLSSRTGVALRYALDLPGVTSAFIGCCNEEQV